MKAMKYILIVLGLISVLTLNAQRLTDYPVAQMHSTSTMVGVGSSLPQAAISGTHTTYDSDGSVEISNGPKKARPDDWDDPYDDHLGDAVLPLLLLAAGYAICVWRKNKSHSRLATPESK